MGSIRITIIFCSILAGINSLSLSAADAKTGELIVRVYFDDETIAHRIAATFEPLEAKYEQGYLLLMLDQEDLARLRGDASRLGIRIESDSERERMSKETDYAE